MGLMDNMMATRKGVRMVIKLKYFIDTCKCGEKHIVTHFDDLNTEDMGTHLGWKCRYCGKVNKFTFVELHPVDRDS